MFRFFIGCDLGKVSDHTSLCVIEKNLRVERPSMDEMFAGVTMIKLPTYTVRFLERLPLQTPYPKVVERIKTITTNPAIHGDSILICDSTGCGMPVIDMLRQESLRVISVWITSGSTISGDAHHRDNFHVPKLNLVSSLSLLIQSERLKVVEELEHAPLLKEEFKTFEVRMSKQGSEQFGAWRSGQHDDLVLSLCMAVWYSTFTEVRDRIFSDELVAIQGRDEKPYSPLTWEL